MLALFFHSYFGFFPCHSWPSRPAVGALSIPLQRTVPAWLGSPLLGLGHRSQGLRFGCLVRANPQEPAQECSASQLQLCGGTQWCTPVSTDPPRDLGPQELQGSTFFCRWKRPANLFPNSRAYHRQGPALRGAERETRDVPQSFGFVLMSYDKVVAVLVWSGIPSANSVLWLSSLASINVPDS